VQLPATQVWFESHALAFCQLPVRSHVCGCEADEHCVCVGPHTPVQEPFKHVVLGSHAAPASCQPLPVIEQVVGTWPTQTVAPGMQRTQSPW
jgi:hypothetical protein